MDNPTLEDLQKQILELQKKNEELTTENKANSEKIEATNKDLENARKINAELWLKQKGGSDTDNNNEGLGGIQQGAGQIVFEVNQTADTNVKVPKTGDETNAVPALIVLAVSASVAVGTLAAGRRRQRR